MSRIPTYKDEQSIREKLRDVSLEHWLKEDLFSFNWWLLLAACILPFFIWWRLVDKGRFFEILAFGLLCAIFACFLDVVGVNFLCGDIRISCYTLFRHYCLQILW